MGKTEKNGKENHATKLTKIPKTKKRKYEMNETYNAPSFGYGHSVIRASDKMKSLLEIYTAKVNRDLIGTL